MAGIRVIRFLRRLLDVDPTNLAAGKTIQTRASVLGEVGHPTFIHEYVDPAAGGGGVTDHGALTGLGDDDHPQYETTAEVAAQVATHSADTTNVHGIADTSVLATDAEVAAMLDQAVVLAPASSARNVIQPTAGAVIAAIVKAHAAQSVDLTQWQDSGGVVLGSVSELGVVTISPGAGGVGLTIIPADYYGEFDPVNRSGFALTYPADPVSTAAVIGFVSLASDTYAPGTYPADRVMGSLVVYSMEESDPGSTTGFVGLDGNGSVVIAPYDYANVPAIRVYDNDANYTFQVSSKGAVAIKTVDVAAGVPFSVGIGASNPYAWWVSAGGHEVLRVQVAALDADVGTSERWQWYDDAVGAPKLMFKQKDSAGTLFTGFAYSSGGTDVALADGGTGASLVDPNADRIMFWDDSAGAVTWLTPGTNLAITGTTLDATAGGGGAPTDASYVTVNAEAGLSAETLYTALKLDDFAAPDDNTDLNASTTKHGLLPKLSNVSTEYLSGTGVYSVPAGAGGASSTDNLFLTRYVCKR